MLLLLRPYNLHYPPIVINVNLIPKDRNDRGGKLIQPRSCYALVLRYLLQFVVHDQSAAVGVKRNLALLHLPPQTGHLMY